MRYFILVIAALAFLTYVHSDACVQCNSATDPNCATNPDRYLAKACVNATSKCYTRVKDGNTIRGCASDLDNSTASRCNNEMECLICTFMEGCNRQVFPLHRASCLQCSGNSSLSTCASNVYEKPTVCPIYQLGDQCYIRDTHKNGTAGSFQRGCLSSAKANKLCVTNGHCYTCEGVGCNFLLATDPQIPVARDSGFALFASLPLLLACVLAITLH